MIKQTVTGFIIDAFHRTQNGQFEIFVILRLEDGRTCGVVENRFQPHFYIRTSDIASAESILSHYNTTHSKSSAKTMDDKSVTLVECTASQRRKLMEALHGNDIRTYEADIKPLDQFLIEFTIHSSVKISGVPAEGTNVDIFFTNPTYEPAPWSGELTLLSFDIETSADASTIYSIALIFHGKAPSDITEEIYIYKNKASNAMYFPSEKEMLTYFCNRIRQLDPDIITGWNLVEFDLTVIEKRCRELGIQFDVSRTGSPVKFLEVQGWRSSIKRVIIEGRQVLDAMWLTRFTVTGLDNYKLETVAREFLDRGKKIVSDEDMRVQKIEELYRENPYELCLYCMEDARLVLDILDHLGLIDIMVQKSLSIGLPLNRVNTSIVSFEHIFIEKLHRRNYVAPSLGVDRDPIRQVPGGGIIKPRPGYYKHVLVFDFKSLYPSLMRTFNLDPLAYAQAPNNSNPIVAPNKARFARGDSIINNIIDDLMQKRDQAKKEGNVHASYAYKIIMNSFYGVLGTDGCRFSSPSIAGAITGFGQFFLRWTRDLLSSWDYEVLYGDTDSIFLLSGLSDSDDIHTFFELGNELSIKINQSLSKFIWEKYSLQSKLEIEFEKYYRRFFLPGIRTHISNNVEKRGRAKGYAGLLVASNGDKQHRKLDIIGLEAVRRDWTELARKLQRDLFELLFEDSNPEIMKKHIASLLDKLYDGLIDHQCVYKKALRKPVSAYTHSKPPHVKAASYLPNDSQKGVIKYVMTRRGPEPIGFSSTPLDYDHYRDKQINPIVGSLDQILNWNLLETLDRSRQLSLFSTFDYSPADKNSHNK